MKKQLFKAIALCCAAIVLGACNKDNTNANSLGGNTLQEQNPIEQLRKFRKLIVSVQANPDARSTETLPLSEALWDIENHFNLTYTDAEKYYAQIAEHEFTLYLPTNEAQEVLVYDAVDLYSQVVAQARYALASDQFEEKGFISLNIESAEIENGQVRIDFSGKTGERTNYNPPTSYVDGPFDINDNWMFASPMGKCDDPDIPSGADEQLQEKLFDELIEPYTEADLGYRNIYLNRKRFVFDGSNYTGIYYSQDPNHLCIEFHEMNAYYQGEKRVISQVIPEQYHLTGYTPISIEIRGMAVDGDAVTHHNEIEYGIRMQVNTDEFGEVQDLLEG